MFLLPKQDVSDDIRGYIPGTVIPLKRLAKCGTGVAQISNQSVCVRSFPIARIGLASSGCDINITLTTPFLKQALPRWCWMP